MSIQWVLFIKPTMLFCTHVQRVSHVNPLSAQLGGVTKRQCSSKEVTHSFNWPPFGSDTSVFRGTRSWGKDHRLDMRWETSCWPKTVLLKTKEKHFIFFFAGASPNVKGGGWADHITISSFLWSLLCLLAASTQVPPAGFGRKLFSLMQFTLCE